jgi:RimJ/RimL family protein N-acetyltransferase
MQMNIREAKVEDWEQLKKLLIDLTNEDPPVAIELEPLIMKGRNWLAEFPKGKSGFFSVAEVKKEKDSTLLISEDNKDSKEKAKIIGFCYLAVPKFYNPVAYIGIALDKDQRRRDIGTEMFYHVAGWAAAENLSYIIADVWSWNSNSIKFFKTLGFVEKQKFEDKFKGKIKLKVRLVKKL